MSVQFELNDGIATITIDRPQSRNALDNATSVALAESIRCLNTDRTIRVGILTGAGGTFCSGMDLKAFLRGEVIRLPEVGFGGVTQARIVKPMIAAIEGYALAGGFEMALACDLLIAAEDAKFGLTEVKRGLVANAGGLLRLPRQLPPKIAAELVLTGEIMPAALLAQHGLVNRLVPTGRALSVAIEYARKIAANAPLAVATSKRVMAESQDWPAAEMFERQFALTEAVFRSADAREGASAFAEKRAPVWRGE